MAITKEPAKNRQDGFFCEFGYWHSNQYNAETIAAFEEAERILRDPNAKTFNSVAELMTDLEFEDDDIDDEI